MPTCSSRWSHAATSNDPSSSPPTSPSPNGTRFSPTPSLELYNLDHAILDDEATDQAKATEHVLVVEGPFDVARLYAAGIRNVVATFGASL